jgi:exodeoxyribonuclease III
VKIATWNVNSIRARHDLVLDWVERTEPDVLCMQETKVVDDEFPSDELTRLGYAVAMAGQKTYNGVALASRLPMRDVSIGLMDDPPDGEKRLIGATVAGVRCWSAYVPNGKSVDSPSFPHKLAWLARLRATLERDSPNAENVVVCGDFNIAPDARDVFDPVRMKDQVHFHPDEHRALRELMSFGLVDAFRLHHEEGGRYSWWDYRAGGVRKNEGLRIDLVLLSRDLAERCSSAVIDADERKRDKPSDHVPVIVEIVDS